ncbi:McrB family protein [Alkalihalobacterium elongatum]|uniref:McrB family protein n=1 Tax=Alkalihalobacterium elongatum TaxID=2675466 RepID=UPI001C1F2CC2|nr:AAA family ATPase [Alkalihalobacterium elongatum]
MENYYLSETTISDSYITLSSVNLKHDGELFTLLILKHAGLTQHDFFDLSTEPTKKKLLQATKVLAYLFISDDYLRTKYNFINPLAMDGWGNNPTEALLTWSTQRLINNVTGGGKQWKSIVINDPDNPNLIKLKHNYLEFFKDMEDKVPLDALSIWCARFSNYPYEIPLSNLIKIFTQFFNITEDEKTLIFSTSNRIRLEYAENRVTSNFIRSLIGNPAKNPGWIDSFETEDIETPEIHKSLIQFGGENLTMQGRSNISVDFYQRLINKAKQAIFMGPPGTSKSFLAKELSEKFNKVKRIQFHPQYSYQDFIGGKILENGSLRDEKGELIDFIEKATSSENPKEEYLLIIEEINRANVSQVFGEMIQLLDRGESLKLSFNGEEKDYYLPDNLKIIGTMNTTDRTVGRIDYAIKRRFYQIYCRPEIGILIDKTRIVGNDFSIADLLAKINQNLFSVLSNKEMVIGHAIFLKDFVYSTENDKFEWPVDDFEHLFNFVVIPLIEDYCNGNADLIMNVIGEKLYNQQTGSEFVKAIKEYLS